MATTTKRMMGLIMGTAAELAARTGQIPSGYFAYATDTKDLRIGPGMWGDLVNAGQKDVVVRVATTANITIATALNAGDTLDGVTLAAGDLVLVKDQSTASQNGIYKVAASPARAPGFTAFNHHVGIVVRVSEGTSNGNKIWLGTANAGGTLGTTDITFAAHVSA